MLMGSAVSFDNNSERRCNIQVYTVGRSFVVIHTNLLPGEKSEHKLHKVWYDIVYDFDDGSRYEDAGKYFGSDQHFKIQDDVLDNENMRVAAESESEESQNAVTGEKRDKKRRKSSVSTKSIKSSKRKDSGVSLSPELSTIGDESGEVEPSKEADSDKKHAATKDEGKPLADDCVSYDFATSPAALFKAIYRNPDFMADFRKNVSKLKDLEIGEWEKIEDGEDQEKRTLKYIMPLDGSLGPKETNCNCTETIQHEDEEGYIAVLGKSQTPDVPYGSSFYTQTRTCFTWNKKGGAHICVTCETNFEKSTMMKGIIKHSAHEGQVKSNKTMIKHLRKWIKEHPDDFPQTSSVSVADSVTDKHGGGAANDHSTADSSDPKDGRSSASHHPQNHIPIGPLQLTTSFTEITPLTILLFALNVYLVIWAYTERCPCA